MIFIIYLISSIKVYVVIKSFVKAEQAENYKFQIINFMLCFDFHAFGLFYKSFLVAIILLYWRVFPQLELFFLFLSLYPSLIHQFFLLEYFGIIFPFFISNHSILKFLLVISLLIINLLQNSFKIKIPTITLYLIIFGYRFQLRRFFIFLLFVLFYLVL